MTTTASKLLCFFALSLGCLFTSCRRENINPIPPSEFTKAQREALGRIVNQSIAFHTEDFELLPRQSPCDTAIYWFIQRLYDQATNVMRIDHRSPTDNRWSSDRSWEVHILVSDEINSFILPGGDFYITTGFLKTLEEEYELYYILSFEVNLMNEGVLLERLVSEINSIKLLDIISRDLGPQNEMVKNLTQILSHLEFDTDEVFENDEYTINAICNTSKWSRLGLIPILESVDDNMEWLTYRPSYNNRAEWLLSLQPESLEDCGSLKTNNPSNEGYKKFVLDCLN